MVDEVPREGKRERAAIFKQSLVKIQAKTPLKAEFLHRFCYTIYSMEEITRRSKLTLGLSKLIAYLIGFWLVFLLAKTLWLNWQLSKSIEKLNQQVAVLEQQKKDLDNLILYYQSD